MEYPKKIYASVLLLDGEIYNWKVSPSPWESPAHVRMDFNDMVFLQEGRFVVETKEFIVNNSDENNKVFEELSKDWFRKWEVSEKCIGFRPY